MLCDLAGYVGDHLLGPILAAVVAGPLAALTFRYFGVPKEVAEHDARASELNEDLRRWVRDRDRQLETELRTLVNQAGSGVVSRYPVPVTERPPPGAGSQLYSGALVNEAVAGMRQALHEYRDEATAKVREFSALARAEGSWHRRHRRRRGFELSRLGLGGQERLYLNRWRQRPYLAAPGSDRPDMKVDDDPTLGEASIAPLETDEGLSWKQAAQPRSM